jgi:hypothetical protein
VRSASLSTASQPAGAPQLVDPAFDDALARIAQLSARLHAVTDLHTPRRALLGGRVCRGCARPFPCPTSRVTVGRPR